MWNFSKEVSAPLLGPDDYKTTARNKFDLVVVLIIAIVLIFFSVAAYMACNILRMVQ